MVDDVSDGPSVETGRVGKPGSRSMLRKTIASITAFLAVLTLLIATIGVWAHKTLLDTDTYVKTVAPLAKDPAVIDAIASDLTDETMTLLDVEKRVREALPEEFRFLSLPLTDAARGQLRQLLVKLMETERFQKLWVSANRLAHKTVVGILRNDLRYFDTANGEVQVDLILVAADVIRELGKQISFIGDRLQIPQIDSDATPAEVRQQVSAAIGIAIPEDFGQVTLLRSDELAAAQRAVVAFDRLVVALVLGAIALFITAIAVSTRRFRMIATLGMSTVLAIVLADAAIRDIQSSAVLSIADSTTRAAVSAAVTAVVGSFGGYVRFIVFVGLTLSLVGFFGSNTAPARAIRRRVVGLWDRTAELRDGMNVPESAAVRWISANSSLLRIGGLVAAVLFALLFHPSLFGLAVLLALLGIYELILSLLAPSDELLTPAVSDSGSSATGSGAASEIKVAPDDSETAVEVKVAPDDQEPPDQLERGAPDRADSTEPDDSDKNGTHNEGDQPSDSIRNSQPEKRVRGRLKGMLRSKGAGTTVILIAGVAAAALIASRTVSRRR